MQKFRRAISTAISAIIIILALLCHLNWAESDQLSPQPSFLISTPDKVLSLCYAPDGKTLASGVGNQVYLWDVNSGKAIRSYLPNVSTDDIRDIKYSSDGQLIGFCQSECAYLWDGSDAKAGRSFELKHGSIVRSVAFGPHDTLFAAASDSRFGSNPYQIKVWNSKDGSESATFLQASGPISSITFSPDGKFIISASGMLQFWDALGLSEQALRPFFQHPKAVAVAHSPDGKIIASGAVDGTVRLWEAASPWRNIMAFQTKIPIDKLEFSRDSKLIGICSQQRQTIQVWSLPPDGNLQLLKVIEGSPFTSLSFSPDGQYLAAASLNSFIAIWKLNSELGFVDVQPKGLLSTTWGRIK